MKLPFFMSLALFTAVWGVLLSLRLMVEGAQAATADLEAQIEEAEENAR
jgi:hypothetical protein